MPSSLYATLNKDTGILTVSKIGVEVDESGPNADATVTVYKMDGSTLSATANLNFWERVCKIGDFVYHDGSYSSAENVQGNVDAGKTPIGLCFYIDPEHKDRRLMVSLNNLANQKWGVHKSNLPNIVLNDNPDLDVYFIKQVPDTTELGFTDYSQLRDEIGGDLDGWRIFDPNVYGTGQLGWTTVIEKVGGYKVGDLIPYGKYYSLWVIETRNLLLSDSAINLPIPEKTSVSTELNNLSSLMSIAVNTYGANYDQMYFPAFSAAHAYRPTSREDLKPEFCEHN